MVNIPDQESVSQVIKYYHNGVISVSSELLSILKIVHGGGSILSTQWRQYQEEYDVVLKQTKLGIVAWRSYFATQMNKYPRKSSYVYLINAGFFEENTRCPARQMYFGAYDDLIERLTGIFDTAIPESIQNQLAFLKMEKYGFFLSILCTVNTDSDENIGNNGSFDFIVSTNFMEELDHTLPRISYQRTSPEIGHEMLLRMNQEASQIGEILELSGDHILKKQELNCIINDDFVLSKAYIEQKQLYDLLMCYSEQQGDNEVQNNLCKAINDRDEWIDYLKKLSRWSSDRLKYIIKKRPEDAFYLSFINPTNRTSNSVFTYYLQDNEGYAAFEELLDCISANLTIDLPDDIVDREELDFCIHGSVQPSGKSITISFDFIGSKVNEQRIRFPLVLSLDELYEFLEKSMGY